MLDDLYNLIVNKDEITWQSLLMDLIKSEEMDPWDIDVSLLARKYLDSIKEMQKFNFFVSGKMILASALLLRIKSDKFMYPPEELDPMEMEAYLDAPAPQREKVKLTIKTPQARKRRVTLSDLMGALQKALEVNQRKVSKKEYSLSIDMEIPVKEIDITALIKDVYSRVVGHFETNEKGELTFSMLVKSDRKEDKILTILPLLHLDNDGKVELNQVEHFGDIYIKLNKE